MSISSIISSVAAQNPRVGTALSSASATIGVLSTLNGGSSLQGLLTTLHTQSKPTITVGAAYQVDTSASSSSETPTSSDTTAATAKPTIPDLPPNPLDPSNNPALAQIDTKAIQATQLLSGMGQNWDLVA